MRLFVASFLPAADVTFYDEVVATLVMQCPGVLRPIPRGSAHMTHAFLGDVHGTAPEEIAADIARTTSGRSIIDVELGKPTVLGGRQPRLVMAPVITGADLLGDLARGIVLTLRARSEFAGLPLPKAPHVTLARFRKHATRTDGRHVAGLLGQSRGDTRSTRVESVEIVRSRLGSGGAEYDTLASFALEPRRSKGP